jgi:hypothetical protein
MDHGLIRFCKNYTQLLIYLVGRLSITLKRRMRVSLTKHLLGRDKRGGGTVRILQGVQLDADIAHIPCKEHVLNVSSFIIVSST